MRRLFSLTPLLVALAASAQVNTAMKTPDGTTTHVQVAARTSGGATDPNFQGPVTLGFASNTTKMVTLTELDDLHT